MEQGIDFDQLDAALKRAGSSWEAAQAHGLLCARLAAEGRDAAADWVRQVLEGTDSANALRGETEALLDAVQAQSIQQLAERQSGFQPLLPDDDASPAQRAEALAHWCEGFLHGLVTGQRNDRVRDKLAAEPLADVIRDLLQITRAAVDEGEPVEDTEQAYAEIVEYVRVAAQMAYEELADVRGPAAADPATRQSLH